MTSAIHRTMQAIPEDVVREIFSQFSSGLEVYNSKSFPWYLGHICVAWRATFLSMKSQFWTLIELEWPRWRQRDPDRFPLPWYTQRVMEMLKFFLQCNQGLPFSFTLCTAFYGYTEEEAQDVNRVLLILVSESSRWENASLNLRASMLPTLYRTKHHLPLLRRLNLELCADDRNDYSVPELYADIFETAPLLASITLNRLSTWKFDWSSLTFVCLDYALNNNLLYGALPLAVRLRGLDIDVPFFSNSQIPATGPIKLPCLIYLRVPSSRFLTVLETPALVDLNISEKQHESTPELNIIDFLRRSSCRLHHLCIVHHDASTVKQILPHTPDIRYLCLTYVKSLSDILLWLANEKSEVPHLETFRILVESQMMKDDEMDKLSHMVASRAPTGIYGKGIKQLTIRKYEPITASQNAALERLISSCRVLGVEFQFPYHVSSCRFCGLLFSDRAY